MANVDGEHRDYTAEDAADAYAMALIDVLQTGTP